MHLARAALRGTSRSLDIRAGRIILSQPSQPSRQHDFSVLASVQWDPDKSQATAGSTQQVRFRRHDRSSAFSKPRPKTKKQRQSYNRKMKGIADKQAKINPPGSKAGPRRQHARERWQQLVDHGNENELLDPNAKEQEYGYDDLVFDDMMGNSAYLTSQPTPEPAYMGHLHRKFYNRVANQMDSYREAMEAQATIGGEKEALVDVSSIPGLPNDSSIANMLRAYRDRHGTRNRPIGIVKALQHILKDVGVPTLAFGEYTYTTLLTCCWTPNEARRIFKLMNDHQHPISSYSWSILVDIHAKLGDFEGCARIIDEMASEGVPPTQAAYTSLMAACYKVCNDGRIPHSLRAKAGKLGWNKWQEMRVVGIEPDAMAYGAIIRLCASRGRPERAINLLEDMQRFEVKPTTLCYSSALRAVAKSHEIAVRFERGWSKKQLRRESFAAHHGKMARQIVILAETAEAEQDEGFVSALMLCAAAAGDSATAKAIYLAAEVRKMDHLRTIGPESHLRQLRGETTTMPDDAEPFMERLEENANLQALTDGVANPVSEGSIPGESHALATTAGQSLAQQNDHVPQARHRQDVVKSFGEREYGHDTRALSAMLRACAQAMDSNGIGTIWAGKSNLGYLCENSHRLITTRWEPSYRDTSVPGVSPTKFGIGNLRKLDDDDDDRDNEKKGTRKKFRGLYLDEDAVDAIDNLKEHFEESFGDDDDDDDSETFDEMQTPPHAGSLAFDKYDVSRGSDIDANDEIVYDSPTLFEVPDEIAESTARSKLGMADNEFELYQGDINGQEDLHANDDSESDGFDIFMKEVLEEAAKNGEDLELSEKDARELFNMMQEEFSGTDGSNEADDLFDESWDSDEDSDEDSDKDSDDPPTFGGDGSEDSEEAIEQVMEGLEQEFSFDEDLSGFSEMVDDASNTSNEPDNLGVGYNDDTPAWKTTDIPVAKDPSHLVAASRSTSHSGPGDLSEESVQDARQIPLPLLETDDSALSEFDEEEREKIQDLQAALPGIPLRRVKKILKAFKTSLGYPSMMVLTPILRETMPDYVSSGWLRRMNLQNAEFVLQKAAEGGPVDQGFLNTMLQVKTSASSLDEAVKFHEEEYRKHKLTPTGYSDRLVMQMLIANNRLPRALAFKQKVEEDGRTMDLPSYGHLVEYYSNHSQLGSALLLLKECISLHGATPSEKYLTKVRLICRQRNLEHDLQLTNLIGEDPIQWLRHGEKYLKRERSKKGQRNVQFARNRI